eukprot:GHVT01008372.1.p1 GENE.GHVT01008372.1~~GHVT01008372.1.p1  ORF type:complete len:456 (-),score=17.15 GHVT01008372.1:1474-2841(-)
MSYEALNSEIRFCRFQAASTTGQVRSNWCSNFSRFVSRHSFFYVSSKLCSPMNFKVALLLLVGRLVFVSFAAQAIASDVDETPPSRDALLFHAHSESFIDGTVGALRFLQPNPFQSMPEASLASPKGENDEADLTNMVVPVPSKSDDLVVTEDDSGDPELSPQSDLSMTSPMMKLLNALSVVFISPVSDSVKETSVKALPRQSATSDVQNLTEARARRRAPQPDVSPSCQRINNLRVRTGAPESKVPLQSEVVLDHLTIPWGIAFLPPRPGNKEPYSVIMTERRGKVWHLAVEDDKQWKKTGWLNLEKYVSGEGGLLDIIAHPNFQWAPAISGSEANQATNSTDAAEGFVDLGRGRNEAEWRSINDTVSKAEPAGTGENTVFLYYTSRPTNGRGKPTNRVIKLRVEHDTTGNILLEIRDPPILEGFLAGLYHNGGRLAFGPDGNLYIGTQGGIPK